MTIERTRELLKDKVANLNDIELLEFINKTELSIDIILQTIVRNKNLRNIKEGFIK